MQNQKYIDMCSGSRIVTAPPIDSGGPGLSLSGHHCSNRFDLGAGHIQAFISHGNYTMIPDDIEAMVWIVHCFCIDNMFLYRNSHVEEKCFTYILNGISWSLNLCLQFRVDNYIEAQLGTTSRANNASNMNLHILFNSTWILHGVRTRTLFIFDPKWNQATILNVSIQTYYNLFEELEGGINERHQPVPLDTQHILRRTAHRRSVDQSRSDDLAERAPFSLH